MALPTYSAQDILAKLRTYKLGIELFDDFPSQEGKVRYGLYCDDIKTEDRSPYALAVNYGGNIYIASDSFKLIFVTFQGDPNRNNTLFAIQDMVNDNVLFNGYHERTYTQTHTYVNRAEYHYYDFITKRMEFQ